MGDLLTTAAVRFYLALLLSPEPVGMAECRAWGFAELGAQLRLLAEAAERGWLAEPEAGASGRFVWVDPRAADELFDRATAEDWQAVLEGTGLPERGPAAAREAGQRGDLRRARLLYRALIVGLRRAGEPDAAAAWLALVMEALRLFRREASWLAESLQEDAYAEAVRLDDLGAQAVLLATRAYEQLRSGRTGDAEAWCRQALELAADLDDPDTRQHVLLYVANDWILLGRLPEAQSMLESFLGDIPPELLPTPSESTARDTLTEASLATLANVYAWSGQGDRALDLLERMVDVGIHADQPLLAKMARVYLAWYYADRGDVERAERFGQEALAGLEPDDVYLWFASQPAAWVGMKHGDAGRARAQLAAGHRCRLQTGHTHFQNSYLFEVLAWLADQGAPPIEGLTLDGELSRMLASPDQRMAGVAYRVRALRTAAVQGSPDAWPEARADLDRALSLLRRAGATVELERTLRAAVELGEGRGAADDLDRYRDELRALAEIGPSSFESVQRAGARESHVARAIVDMGRLTLLAHRREGFFGDVAARICKELNVERCALYDVTEAPRLLSARGGDRSWLAELETLIGTRPPTDVDFLAPLASSSEPRASGQLVLIPYRIEHLERCGFVALENRRRSALVGPRDRALLESLGVQMSVLIGNVALWQELSAVRQRLERENRYYRSQRPGPVAGGRMVGESPAFRRLFELIAKIAPTQSAVLIQGETGVGKELVAREIHGLSAHRHGPFIAAHVASMAPGLVASTLFGHERGAFTGATEQVRGRFELADGGTLFLDEVGELGPEDQVRLLRVLQEGSFERVGGQRTIRSRFRLVAATNRDLEQMVGAGSFREDLFYRLNVFPIVVPPLRDRRDDIPRLALHFLDRFMRQAGRQFEGIGEADVDRLVAYDWPGNVRELEHVIERAVVLSQPPMLKIPELEAPTAAAGSGGRSAGRWVSLEEHERRYVAAVLEHCEGRISGSGGAAELLGLKPSTLQSRIDKLGLRDALRRSRARATR